MLQTSLLFRNGVVTHGLDENTDVMKPPQSPNPKAARVLPTAKLTPSVATVVASIAGSVIGDASQKAMTGANGIPAASKPAIKGNIVMPQTGVIAPIAEATITVGKSLPSNARAIWASAPLAMTQAVRTIPGTTTGATESRLRAIKRAIIHACVGQTMMAVVASATARTIRPIFDLFAAALFPFMPAPCVKAIE